MEDTESRSQVVLRRSHRLLGMSNPEDGSNQLAPRKSARLSIKSRRTMSERLAPRKPSRRKTSRRKTSRSNRKIPNFEFFDFGDCPITFRSYSDIASLRRSRRQANALHFWLAYSHVYDTIPDGSLNIKETKRILVSNRMICNEIDKSHGMTWVAVHGADFICVVFRNKAPDMKRILERLGRGLIMTYFGKHVLSDMEDIADSSEYQIDGKPFAVVSVNQETENAVDENCYKASGDEIDEKKAVEFLMCETDRESALTKTETIKTAIAGFHYLFKEKLKPEDVWVTFFHDDGQFAFFQHLDTPEIKKHMNDINKPRSQLPSSRERCFDGTYSLKLRPRMAYPRLSYK